MNTEQERAELLPCPFCGGDHLKLFGESAPEWWVCCETCKAATQTRTNKSQAIEDWNRRAALQSQDREDAERIQFMADEACTFNTWKQEDGSWKYRLEWDHGTEWQTEWFSTPEEAIDHARRVEGDGNG